MELLGREQQLSSIDNVLQAARDGFGGALVLRGEAGIGKTALLDYAIEQATDLRVVRITGTEWEMNFAYAGLHQLTHPFLENLDALPTPQLKAMHRAYGLDSGPEPNRFMVALAALTLLSEIASRSPLLCALDDAHWIDEESLGALAFVARRLDADSLAMIFAAREPSDRLAILDGLPSLEVRGLDEQSARELLRAEFAGAISRPVADRLVTETRGNPLGLIALGSELTEDQVAGGFLPDLLPLSQRVEARFTRRIHRLPPSSQMLLLVAAAEATGTGDLLWLAGDRLGFGKDAARDHEIDELLDFGPPIAFRHPLIRSAIYYGASTADRTMVHQTLAAVIDPDRDPDRWAWHLGSAAVAPDERAASALQRAAERGRSRGGFSGAATLLTRSAELTAGRKPRAGRLLAAAAAAVMAGAPLRAQGLLDLAGPGLSTPSQHAEALRLRGATLRLRFEPGATASLIAAARALAPLDNQAARDTWLAALEAEILAQRDTSGSSLRHVAEEALGLQVDSGRPISIPDLLLNGLATRVASGHEAAVPILREAVTMMRAGDAFVNAIFESPWWLGDIACRELWDDLGRKELLARLSEACRQHGALFLLSVALLAQFERETWVGRFALAEALFVEGREITAAIGMNVARWDLFKVTLLGWQGRDAETRLAVQQSIELCEREGTGALLYHAYAGLVILELGGGRYAEAVQHADRIFRDDPPGYGTQILPDLVEAGSRSGNIQIATAALGRLSQRARAAGTPLALGLLARSRALVADDGTAEPHYTEGIEQLSETESRTELARARLLYGEWLRRNNRRLDAREQLRAAYELFDSLGANGYAQRARAELTATGETARKRAIDTRDKLTPQEERIARFAAAGSTNPEIAAQMFLSPSTVEYHLRKVFRKLDLSSRRQLRLSFAVTD